MEKNVRNNLIYPILILLTVITGIYAFTQALQVPLTESNAEKVLSAWNILQHNTALSSWKFSPIELSAYLLFVKILGIGTFSSIAVNVFFYLLPFCSGLLILKSQKILTFSNLLIWIALTGLPDPVWMGAVQNAAFLISGLLLLPHFLSVYFEGHQKGSAIAALFCCIGTALSLPKPFFTPAQPYAIHETLRALQSVFRADFSQQPLLQYNTGRYFLMTVVLLLMVWSLFRTVRSFFRHENKPLFQYLYALLIFITILWCSFPFSGDRDLKRTFCAWLPFGTAMLLILIKEEYVSRDLHFAQGRLKISTLVNIFAALTILFGISPIVLSRPASPADRVVIFLTERGQRQGYCEEKELALLTVAAKGRISFTTDPGAFGNSFSIFQFTDKMNEHRATEIIPPYRIMIYE